MDDHTEFSFEVRLVIARLARLVCKFDGGRTALSSEQEVMALIAHAAQHQRPEIQSLFDELLYLMGEDELAHLSAQGVVLPDAYARLLPEGKRQATERRRKRVYRGQIVED
ncbi:hypothetical protein [Aquisalimonas asiatica]|uniref:Uncharacterized protein n=1 Tax=Aquisalimonas asiatica TaxID=406100 RepID=A0A1H8PQY3_9GAMM|nr:hypothetical protein [Aquisalimonas asiatica]SEO44335.1 hypothetical protein SAMN04488052_101102 [Aquisalimonas asiatica]